MPHSLILPSQLVPPLQGDLKSILDKLVPALLATGYQAPSEAWLEQILAQDTEKNDKNLRNELLMVK